MVPINVEYWGDNLQFHPNFAPFSTLGGMKLDHYCFHASISREDQKKDLHGKFEELLFKKSSKDQQKKGLQKLKSFCPRKPVKTKRSPKTNQCSDADHSQFIRGMQMQTIVKLFGGCSQIIVGIYRIYAPPGFGTPA